jgi:hypothetical protein
VSVPGFWNERVPELLDEVVGMYRAAGRPLAQLADDELDVGFIDTVEAYIADPRTSARFRAVNDVAAEYVLRRRAAPIERVVRLREGPEDEAINQPDKRKLSVFIEVPGFENILPMIVLAFGRFGTVPGLGAIFSPEGSDKYPPSWDKNLTEPELKRAKERWRDERHAEFEWLLLGRSAARDDRVVSFDDARARRAAG